MKVVLTYNLKRSSKLEESGLKLPDDFYAECDDLETVEAIRGALSERHQVVLIEADEDCFEKFRRERPDIVFNIAEGVLGASREAQVPAILEMLGIPYIGSDPLTVATCLDKSRTKEILSYYRIPNPEFRVISSANEGLPEDGYPYIVKPLYEGSSKGIKDDSVVKTPAELRRKASEVIESYLEPAIVERFLKGREFTVALLGNANATRVLPIVEMVFESLPSGANPIYSYEAKWVWDRPEKPLEMFRCPAQIGAELKSSIESLCLRAYRALRCRDWCRMDVRLDAHGEPNILEVNPLPGILPKVEDNSCYPKAARAVGMTYNQLINAVLDIAVERWRMSREQVMLAARPI